LLLAGLIFALQLLAYADYFTDDSWIYARFATNLVAGDGLVFNPGERIHAATSPIWASLVAALILLGSPVVAGMKILAAAFGVAALLLAWRLARRRYGGAAWPGLFLMLLATEPWFVRWTASGMETPVAVFLLLVAMEAGLRDDESVAWSRLGWSLGLLPLVRPETLLLGGLVAGVVLLTPVARARRAFWIGLITPVAVWALFALPYYGAVLPATLQAKSTPLGLVPERMLFNFYVLARIFAVALALPTLAFLAGLLRSPRHLLLERAGQDWLRPAFVLWSVGLPLVYVLRDVQVVSRYLEVVLPVILVLGVDELLRWPRARVVRLALCAQVAAVLAFSFVRVMPSANDFGRSLAGLVEIGDWLRDNSDATAEVAAYDIGAVGYASGRHILDLGGLVQPGINDLRNEVDDARILSDGLFLQFGQPEWLVDRDPEGAVLDGVRLGQFRCEPVMSRTVQNLGLTRPQAVVYTLYRLNSLDN